MRSSGAIVEAAVDNRVSQSNNLASGNDSERLSTRPIQPNEMAGASSSIKTTVDEFLVYVALGVAGAATWPATRKVGA